MRTQKWWEFTGDCFWLTNTITPRVVAFLQEREKCLIFFSLDLKENEGCSVLRAILRKNFCA